MNLEHIALWIPAVISVIAAIYTAGVQAQTVKSHEKRLNAHSESFEKHDEKFEKHSEKLQDHAVRLEGHSVSLKTLTAWHDGFSAGAHRG